MPTASGSVPQDDDITLVGFRLLDPDAPMVTPEPDTRLHEVPPDAAPAEAPESPPPDA